nr:MAG TPA: hypothetical protein [Caudoviricetes sp.]
MNSVPLSKDARTLLTAIKNVQTSLSSYVYIDIYSQKVYPISEMSIENTNKSIGNGIFSSYKVRSCDFKGTMQYLVDNNLVSETKVPYIYQLKYIGKENSYLRLRDLLSAIITHIIFPSLVAFITTLITLFLTK